MGNNNDAVFKFKKEVFKPCNRFKIKTVGRFVEDKVIWISEQCLSKENANLLTFVKVTHHLVVVFFFKAKTRKHLFNLVFSFVPAELTEFSLHVGSLHSVFIRKIFLCIDGIDILFKLIELWITHLYSFLYGIFIVLEVVLAQNSKALTRSNGNVTCVTFKFTGQKLEEC